MKKLEIIGVLISDKLHYKFMYILEHKNLSSRGLTALTRALASECWENGSNGLGFIFDLL